VPASFPPAVEAAALAAVRSWSGPPREPRPPGASALADRLDLPLIAVDPAGSTDLDQAFHIERSGDGHVVWYAIADVAAFVAAGDAVDVEARVRGTTVYLPGRRAPLHPPSLSEGAASLLAGQVRPSLLWRFDLDSAGAVRRADVRRSLVRVREALSYDEAQRRVDAGDAGSLGLLREVGEARIAAEVERGGISLELPEQDVTATRQGYLLSYRQAFAVERWNAQLSLLTGMTAAGWFVEAGVGPLRTLPDPPPGFVESMAMSASALGVPWRGSYSEALRALDPSRPADAALMSEAARGLRGAGYRLAGSGPPGEMRHAAVASHYTHATAPLRRLIDRFAGEVAVAIAAGRAVPGWVLDGLDGVVDTMGRANRRAAQVDNAVVDLIEALLLSASGRSDFRGVVVAVGSDGRGRVQLADPPVLARVEGATTVGVEVDLRLELADPESRDVRFSVAR